MQQQMIQEARTGIAPEPGGKIARAFFLSVGTFAVVGIIFSIGLFLLPEPLHDELAWNQFHINDFPMEPFFPLSLIIFPYVYIAPFINMPVGTSFKQWKWRLLARKRKEAREGYTTEIPLPEMYSPLPDMLSLQLRRNWRATFIGGAVYAPLIGYMLLMFVLDWQANMQYLAQREEISAWALLGGLGPSLFYCAYIFPALQAFVLAPRQRIIATQNGLVCYRGLSFCFVPWSEARLFAVIAEQKGTRVFELSDSKSVIRWSSKPRGNYGDTFPAGTVGTAPLGMIKAESSVEDYQWQVLQLVTIVADRTHLPLYNLL